MRRILDIAGCRGGCGIGSGGVGAHDPVLEDREEGVAQVTQGVVHHGVFQVGVAHEVQGVVECLEELDEQREDERALEHGEQHAEDLVEEAQRERRERLGENFADQTEHERYDDDDQHERNDVQHGGLPGHILLQKANS